MKRSLLHALTFCALLCPLLPAPWTLAARAESTAVAEATEPAILKIRGRVVTVQVPAGFERVTLQALTSPRKGVAAKQGRATAPEWKTVAVQQANGNADTLTFRLAKLTGRRNLRVFGNRTDTLPGSFFTGITDFLGDPPAELGTSGTDAAGGGLIKSGAGDLALADSATMSASSVGGVAAVRTVVEADIWKVNGDRLYFFNERRGLQVFDIANPDDPALLGSLRMPAAGEDMYLLDDAHVVLLKKAWDYFWFNDWTWWDTSPVTLFGTVEVMGGSTSIMSNSAVSSQWAEHSSTAASQWVSSLPAQTAERAPTLLRDMAGRSQPADASSTFTLAASTSSLAANSIVFAPYRRANQKREIVVADVSAGKPAVLSRVEFEGSVRESRLVGKVLYLATEGPNPLATTPGVTAPWGVTLTSFDLHDLAHPVRRASVFLGGWANAVMATDRFFFVAKWAAAGGGNVVDIIDIADPNGAMTKAGQVNTAGNITDKFKLHLEGDVLAAVSSVNRPMAGEELTAWQAANPRRTWIPWVAETSVATFSLAEPAKPQPLDSISFAPGETVRASRFDAGVAYVVTFRQVDPLWIIDLRDPAALRKLGHVEAPGFSTYIEPLGDRLATIGYVGWKPAVSLFDVRDPAAPKLLSQEVLSGDGWISSEATYNEKAFGVFPEKNLILLPLSQWRADGKGGGVQLFDLFENRLVKRGVARHDFDPRRTALHGDRIVAISPTSLVTINAANRDKPVITSDVQISWPVNRVFLAGDFLVQLGTEWSGGANTTSVTIAAAARPDESLAALDLASALPVVGATVRDGVLYVLQQQGYSSDWIWDATTQRSIQLPPEKRPANLALSAFDLSHLPALALLGATSLRSELAENAWVANGEALAVGPGVVAWSFSHYGSGWFRPYWYLPMPYTISGGSTGEGQIMQSPGRWYSSWVNNYTQRVFTFDIGEPEAPKLVSALEVGTDKPWHVSAPFATGDALYFSYQYLGAAFPQREWDEAKISDPAAYKPDDARLVNRHFLQVADYSDPAAPKLDAQRPNLPGRLVGVARDGALLLTVGQRYALTDGAPKHAEKALHASALDGAVAHLVDQIPLTSEWQPFVLRGDTVFLFDAQAAQVWKPLPPGMTPTRTSAPQLIGGESYYDGQSSGTWEDNAKLSTLTTWQLGGDGHFAKLDEATLGHETQFTLAGNLAVAWNHVNSLRLLDATRAAALRDLGTYSLDGSPWVDVSRAAGDPKRGLWIPADSYGVDAVLLGK